MSARSSIQLVGRALAAATRASPVAGPSRIPLPSPRPRSFATTHVARRPVDEICARTAAPMLSMLDALAILRAVESKYGEVVEFTVPRDPDSLAPTNLVFFKLLHPFELGTKRHIHEIPTPRSEFGDKEIYGGPSLADVQAILTPDHVDAPRSGRGRRDAPTGKVITFEIEMRKTPARTHRTRDPTAKRVTAEMIEEDEKILKALEKFGDGFYGAFEGVAKQHREVLKERKALLEGKRGQSRDSEGSVAAADDVEDAESPSSQQTQRAEASG